MLRTLILALPVLCSSVAALVTLWIVLPAPTPALWLVAVGASEWSLFVGALGLLGALLGLVVLALDGHWVGWIGIVLGLLAGGLALVPPVEAASAARTFGVAISLRRYVLGSAIPPRHTPPQTITYTTIDGQPLMLDAYLPAEPGPARPAIIVIHGGSWSSGDKSDFPRWNGWLVQHGYAVFDIQYRLAPQPNWQTATADVKCAIGWVKLNAARYGVDPDRITLLGRSAGGHLALLAAYTSREAMRLPSCTAADTSVRAVIAFYAPTDLRWGYDHPVNQRVIDGPGTLRRFLGGDPHSASAAFRLASPTTHVNAETPPTLLVHGGRDQLVSATNMELLAQRLRAANVPHQAVYLPYAQHGFDYNFNGWGSQIVQPLLLQFLHDRVQPRKQTNSVQPTIHSIIMEQ